MAKKMTIDEAAKFYGVSKEAIHNRIRRGTLSSHVEDGVKYVHVDTTQKAPPQKKPSSVDAHFNHYLQEQNQELLQKIEKLENETRRLREEKEQMLIQERKRIEQIYKEKDEQLKSILNAISSKFLLEAKPLEEEIPFEAEIQESIPTQPSKRCSLKKHLKTLEISQKKKEKILKKAQKLVKKEERFIQKGDKIYIDLTLYSYDDLF
jgi:valyl-tRNA synthetase